MSEWVPAVPRMKDKHPAESMDMPQGDGTAVYFQVLAGLIAALFAAFFLYIIYAMLKNRDLVYCDVMKFHKQRMTAVLGTGTGKGGGRDLEQEGATVRGGKACSRAPLHEWITVQVDANMDGGKKWRAKGPTPEHKLFNGPVSIV